MRLTTQLTAYGLVFLSMWLCGRKSLWGPALGALSCLPWIAMAVQCHTPTMIGFEVIMLGLELRMLWLWWDERQPTLRP